MTPTQIQRYNYNDMNLDNFLIELFTPEFPLKELKKLHGDLSELDNFLQIRAGTYHLAKDDIQKIYRVQEIIEDIVKEEKDRVSKEKKAEELEKIWFVS